MNNKKDVKIGVSLNPLYLSQHEDDQDQQWFGEPDAFLSDLKAQGATHIELRAIRAGDDLELANTALKRVWDSGLEITIHGVLPALDEKDNWPKNHSTIINLLEQITARYQQNSAQKNALCPIALHCFASKDMSADKKDLADKSVERLIEVADWLKEKGLAAKIALEINRQKKQVDPSTTYEGVVDMQSRASRANIGICWDMGHTWSNIQNGFMKQQPPSEFTKNVIHTHIHDLGPTGITHWPLTEGRMDLPWFAKQLINADYQGVWNLEFEPKRYSQEAQIRPRIIKSVGRMIATIEQVSPD